MDTQEYGEFVASMAFVPQTKEYNVIGLGGEVGEVLNEVKKEMRPGATSRRTMVADELGDTLYYLVSLAKVYGYSLENIMRLNMAKLEARKIETGIPGDGCCGGACK